jgi:hypothetical protein
MEMPPEKSKVIRKALDTIQFLGVCGLVAFCWLGDDNNSEPKLIGFMIALAALIIIRS